MKSLVLVAIFFCSVCHADEFHLINGNKRIRNKHRLAIEDASVWMKSGQKLLQDEVKRQRYERIDKAAKNVIFFLGDGMSTSTVAAARIYKGQKVGRPGEEEELSFDKFPYAAFSRTYCTDAQVADSACSATAYLSGVKTRIDTLGLDDNVIFKNCSTQNNPTFRVTSIMDWAQAVNKGTGVVTTTRITHATPAAAYAHVAQRDWEDDSMVTADGADSNTCDDIAEQLIQNETGKKLKVILGGGRSYFTPTGFLDPETGANIGRRRDGKNLINQWVTDHPTGAYVNTRDELVRLNLTKTDAIFGLFSGPSHLEYFVESQNANNPTLAEMTETAIKLLQKEANGYVLLVEGGRIDHAHHGGLAKISLEETIQFDLAIEAALAMTKRDDTLIIVSADHSHTLTISGYPDRGNDILGVLPNAQDGMPYATLSYANGPGYTDTFVNGSRVNLTGVDTTTNAFRQPAGVPLSSETHGGDDVGIYAIGPQAHLFQGTYEQHYIAHVIGYASCIGPGLHYCQEDHSNNDGSTIQHQSIVTIFISFGFAIYVSCLSRF